MKQTIVALVEDKPGVLNRVASLFRRRNFNIESLTVGHTATPGLSQMTLVVDTNRTNATLVQSNLYKLINVVDVQQVNKDDAVIREMALIKVRVTKDTRPEVIQLAEIFRGRIVDVALDALVLEITGPEERVDRLIKMMENFGIEELVRTGRVAMSRGKAETTVVEKYLARNGNGRK
ncbi:MAG: acetolactate synthase small subunit [Anaerolineae bacterium]